MKKIPKPCFLIGFFAGVGTAMWLGLDFKNYTPERKQRLVAILKGKSS